MGEKILRINKQYQYSFTLLKVFQGLPSSLQKSFQWPAWPSVDGSKGIFLTSPNTLFFP